MSVTTSILKKACNQLNLKYSLIDSSGIFLEILLKNGKSKQFIANNLGINSEVVAKICKDKSYVHALLSTYIRMPKSDTYIDPDPPETYKNFTTFRSNDEIISDILKKREGKSIVEFPILIKPNSGTMGINVFKCQSELDIIQAVKTIFDKKSYTYDHVLLVQEYIQIKKEYRVVVYNQKIQFAYLKDNTQATAQFTGNFSPLHYANARAAKVTDEATIVRLQEFISPIFSRLDLRYAGLDIAVDELGKLYLLEINSKPGFTYFVRDNGEQAVLKMFQEILQNL